MAEKTVKGIAGVENMGIMSQLLSPFLPFEYDVKKEPSVATGEVDGSLYYRQQPGEYEYKGLTSPAIVSGGIDFFRNLIADPTGTAGGIASAVADEVKAFPERQLRTGMSGGEAFNPETGEIDRYDPFAVPLLQGAGTAASIARISDKSGTVLGNMGGLRSKSGQEKYDKAIEMVSENPDITPEELFEELGVYFDPRLASSFNRLSPEDIREFSPEMFRFEMPTYNTALINKNKIVENESLEESDFKKDPELLLNMYKNISDNDKLGPDVANSMIAKMDSEKGTKGSVQAFQNSDNGEFLHASSEGFGLKPDTPYIIADNPMGNPFVESLNVGGGKFIRSNRVKLEDILDFPELFEEYPKLRNVHIVRLKPLDARNNFVDHVQDQAAFAENGLDGEYTIAMGNTPNPIMFQSNLMHEVQHAIQHIENFPEGSSPKLIQGKFDEILDMVQEEYPKSKGFMDEFLAFKIYEQMFGEVEARLVSERFDFITDPDASREFSDPQSANKFLREIDPEYFRQRLMGIDPESILLENNLASEFIERGLLDIDGDPNLPLNEKNNLLQKSVKLVTEEKFSDFSLPELITAWTIDQTKVPRQEVANRLKNDPNAVALSNQALDNLGYGDTVPVYRFVMLKGGEDVSEFLPEGLVSATLDPKKLKTNIDFMDKTNPVFTDTTQRIVRYDVPRDKVAGYLPAFSNQIEKSVNKAVKAKGIGQNEISGLKKVTNPAQHSKNLLNLQDEIIVDVSELKPNFFSANESPLDVRSLRASEILSTVSKGKIDPDEFFSEGKTVLNPFDFRDNPEAFEAAERKARQQFINEYSEFFNIKKMQDGGAVSPNFVSRIMDPKSPMTQDNAMVQLMNFTIDGRFFVAPTVFPVDSPVGPVLTKFSPDMAINKAFNTGEFLEFDTKDQAREFAMRFTDVINVEDRPKQNLKKGIAEYIPYMQ